MTELPPTAPRLSVPMPEKAWVIEADDELPVRNIATSQARHRRRLQIKRGFAYGIQYLLAEQMKLMVLCCSTPSLYVQVSLQLNFKT
jgi:hypothetical protein